MSSRTRLLCASAAVLVVVAAVPTFVVDGILNGPAVMNGSARGTALVMLVLALPVLALGTLMSRGGSPVGAAAVLGALAYLTYNATLLVYATPFNELFLAYVALPGLSFWSMVSALLDPRPPHRAHALPARGIAAFILVVVGLVVGGVGAAGAAVTLVAADQMARDDDGFLTSPRERLTTDGFAITSEDAHLQTDETLERLPDAVIGDVRLSADAAGGTEVFVGIGAAADVRTYLAGVQHDTLVEVQDGEPVYRSTPGEAPASPPTEQTFWVAEASGIEPALTWAPAEGDWSAVVMNADGSAAIDVDVSAGAEVPVLSTAIAVLFVVAALLFLLGAVLVAVPIRAVTRRTS